MVEFVGIPWCLPLGLLTCAWPFCCVAPICLRFVLNAPLLLTAAPPCACVDGDRCVGVALLPFTYASVSVCFSDASQIHGTICTESDDGDGDGGLLLRIPPQAPGSTTSPPGSSGASATFPSPGRSHTALGFPP